MTLFSITDNLSMKIKKQMLLTLHTAEITSNGDHDNIFNMFQSTVNEYRVEFSLLKIWVEFCFESCSFIP